MDYMCVGPILAFGQGLGPGLDVHCIVQTGDQVRRLMGPLTYEEAQGLRTAVCFCL